MRKNIYQDLIKKLSQKLPHSEVEFSVFKRKYAKLNNNSIITNAELLSLYRKMVKSKELKADKNLIHFLRKRQVRTISGVAPVAVLTKPYQCPGQCIYCPSEKNMPKSYLSNEPAVMRAKLCQFDPFLQVQARIKALENNGHDTDKIELIVMGGTWDYLPAKYRLWFIYNCFKAANDFCHSRGSENPMLLGKSKTAGIPACAGMTNKDVTWQDLYHEQKKNETAKHRIVGLTLETRPDYVTEKSAWLMRQLGCTRVEIGVQHLDDKILKLNQRGATVADTIRATKILRAFGFKITYHLMLNLPGSDFKKDFLMFKKIFSDPNFQPDQIKIYPCVVNKHAELYKLWRAGGYKPYTTAQLKKLLIKIKKIVPDYVRIIRVIRDIPEESIAAGNKVTNLRDLLNVQCKCIRCREVGHVTKCQMSNVKCQNKSNKKQIKLFIEKYQVNGGAEYFLSFESKDKKILYAFCRLRQPTINNQPPQMQGKRSTIKKDKKKLLTVNCWLFTVPLIRELHTYGQLVPIGGKIKAASQHQGLGQKLLKIAEKIAKQNGFGKIAVIAGIGAREYYKKFGYQLKNTYMVKIFKK